MLSFNDPILVTGAKGQLGYDVVKELVSRGFTHVIGTDKDELDLTDEKSVKTFVLKLCPKVIFHNAAWTAVDKAEQFPDLVYRINALVPKYLTEAAKEIDATILSISTDYVYSGKGKLPFKEDDLLNPASVYGRTKAEGENFVRSYKKHFIVRTSWVFGINGNNFVKTMIRLGQTHQTIQVVSDQIGSPTYTRDLSKLLVDMAQTDKYGTYNASNEGFCSWAVFARAIFQEARLPVTIVPVDTEEYVKAYPGQAKRPLNSRMDKSKLISSGFPLLPSWQDALKRFFIELEEAK